MSEYFKGHERLEVFEKTGAMMRMGLPSHLEVSDYQTLRNLISKGSWDEALSYLSAFHVQNMFMNSVYFEWIIILTEYYIELTSVEAYKKIYPKVLADYEKLLDGISKLYPADSEIKIIKMVRDLLGNQNLTIDSGKSLFSEMEKDYQELSQAFNEKKLEKSLELITRTHHHAVIRHDSLSGFIYTFPSTVVGVDGETLAVELSNGSVMKNQKWLGLWELSKVLSPVDLAAFLGEHLRFHFSGDKREGKTTIVEDDKKIRLVFDPCGSGGAIRRRLGNDVVNLQEKHPLAWNKCGEVNLYCTHCALNEKYSIDLFGYPKLVVEFEADPSKPCGWTIYKNKEDVPSEVYERLGVSRV